MKNRSGRFFEHVMGFPMNIPTAPERHIDYTDSQLPSPPGVAYGEGGSDHYLYVDPQYPDV